MHNGLSRSSKGVDFGTNRKRVPGMGTSYWSSVVTLVLSCRFSEIIRAFVRRKPLFHTPPVFLPMFQGVTLGVDTWCWDLQRMIARPSVCLTHGWISQNGWS